MKRNDTVDKRRIDYVNGLTFPSASAALHILEPDMHPSTSMISQQGLNLTRTQWKDPFMGHEMSLIRGHIRS